MNNEQYAILRLIRSEGIGPIRFYKLVDHYGTAQKVIDNWADVQVRIKSAKLCPEKQVDWELKNAALKKITPLFYDASDYPEQLKDLTDHPPVLMVKGDKSLLYKKSIAIVGARNSSLNGNKLTYLIAKKLGSYGWGTISGLARGIDKSAHEGSLSTGTVAVVAGGVDVVYPEENKKLYDQICEQGIVVSECAVGMTPQAQGFPRRNRLISALSKGVLVVEASLQSGSMITANNALDQGREVFAVPGSPLDPRCRGPNKLIKQGAKLIESAEDILDNLSEFFIGKNSAQTMDLFNQSGGAPSKTSKNVMEKLGGSPVSLDSLAEAANITLRQLLTVLSELELEEKITRHPGGRISLRLQA